MTPANDPRIAALQPLISRVRTDVTATYVLVDGKKQVKWDKLHGPVPLDAVTLPKHLNGGPARGVSFMQPGSAVTMVGMFDLDSHEGETPWPEMAARAGALFDSLSLAWGMDPVAFTSSGGRGVHIYLLWDGPQDAYTVREMMVEVLAAHGLRNGTNGGLAAGVVEIFPKRDRVREGGYGTQVFLPLAGKSQPLVLEDLSGMLVPVGVESLVGWQWPLCPDLTPRERPARAVRVAGESSGENWRLAADALKNGADGSESMDYDDFVRFAHAVHYETDGSDDGLALVEDVAARSLKYKAGFVESKVWNYASDREGGVTGATIEWLASRLYGWRNPEHEPNTDDFSALPDVGRSGGSGVENGSPGAVERGSVPPAQHLCTDQANANRLVKVYGARVLVAGGRWHVWDGVRWRPDDADVYRYACRLSAMIKGEAATVRRRAREASLGKVETVVGADGVAAEVAVPGDGSTGRVEKAEKIAEALDSWGVRSESKGAIEAAIGLARKMLTVDVALLDTDPWLLNCLNGVVDVRTGEIREHRASDLITKLVPVKYLGMSDDARCAVWEQALAEIFAEDGPEYGGPGGGGGPLCAFLRRWAGYCATGLVREQVFVVHWGDGSNGKSAVLDSLARVLGDYAGTAAPGLIASSGRDGGGDRHPTEIAALLGKRMVTAHETKEGVQLREDFVKQATGGDKLVARYMREDFFEFKPTHKLQLLTNSKPVVRGQDHGIWRRVRLLPYTQKFGSAADVAAGKAARVSDLNLLEALGTPAALSGILGWVVRGAVEWANGGLREPAGVLEASEGYRHEQDRVRQFVVECCRLGVALSEALTVGMSGLYPAYTEWCREGGYHALARGRFVAELQRVVPGFRSEDAYQKGDAGTGRRKILRVWGLQLLQE